MVKQLNQELFKTNSSFILIHISDCYQYRNHPLSVINCFIFKLKISILYTYIDVFILQGGTSRNQVDHYLVILYRLLNTRLDAVIRECSQSLQREPRNIERDKDYPSSATQEKPSPLSIHRFDFDVKLEVYL